MATLALYERPSRCKIPVFLLQGDYKNAIATFEPWAIATGSLPPRVVNDLTYNLAQLNLAGDNPRKALTLLNKWFAAFGEARLRMLLV